MNYLANIKDIETIILDVDGVLTDASILIMESGALLRQMNTKDGYAIKRAIKEGLRVAIITGGNSEGVAHRLRNLGIEDIYTSAENKMLAFDHFMDKYELDPRTVLYMGDDLADYPVMQSVAIAACPYDAVHEIQEICTYISPYPGGKGCVRDVIEKVMRLKRNWLPEEIQSREVMKAGDED